MKKILGIFLFGLLLGGCNEVALYYNTTPSENIVVYAHIDNPGVKYTSSSTDQLIAQKSAANKCKASNQYNKKGCLRYSTSTRYSDGKINEYVGWDKAIAKYKIWESEGFPVRNSSEIAKEKLKKKIEEEQKQITKVKKKQKDVNQKQKIVKQKKLKTKVTKVAKNYNTNSYKGKSFQAKNGVVYEGWSKQRFCKQEYAAGWDSAWCRKKSSYFQNGIEVNEWKGKPGRFAIFKDVTSPINTNAWDNKSFGNGTFHAIAYGWSDVQKIIDQLKNKVSNPKTINFTIKDKKEQCETIGFKPQTEKFADCVLRLVELDVKKQQSNVALSNNNSTNNAIAKQLEIQNKQLERQRYDEGTKFLFDLSRQLSQPKSSSWSTCSYIDFGHGMGKVKCN